MAAVGGKRKKARGSSRRGVAGDSSSRRKVIKKVLSRNIVL